MMKMMPKTQSMKIRVPKNPFCENVLHTLGTTPPKPRFESAQMSLCCKAQWKLARARPELDGQDTRHLTRASFLSLPMRSPQEAANLENEGNQ